MLKQFQVTFRVHQFGREKTKVPKNSVFIRLYYDPESWDLTLYFMYQEDPQKTLEERIIIFNNEPPGHHNVDRYLGQFMAKPTLWYVYFE